MDTHFIEVTNNDWNWGKFMLGRLTEEEWAYKSAMPGSANRSLLGQRGWSHDNILVLDLETREGAVFTPHGCPSADLSKHKIWVCPMYQPFLEWLYTQDLTDLSKLPHYLDLPDAEPALAGYRREGK